MKEWLPTILCCVLAAILFTQRCGDGGGGSVDTVVVTRVDTVRGNVTINKWFPVKTLAGEKTTDTVYVLADYDSVRYYEKDFKDSTISGTVKLQVSQNKLQSFGLDYKALNKTTTITLREFKPSLYVGGFVGTKNDYGAQLIYADKTKAYTGGYNFQDKSFSVGIAIKIK